jgi:transaldolase
VAFFRFRFVIHPPRPTFTLRRTILIDSADRTALTICLAYPGVQGFTTNPTLIARSVGLEHLPLAEYQASALRLITTLQDIAPRDGQRRDIMLQAAGSTEEILAAAREWQSQIDAAHWRLWIKILPEWRAFRAIRALRESGVLTLVTAVYTATQARLSFEAGADGVAVYVGRLSHAEAQWEDRLSSIAAVARRAERRLLLAGFPDLDTVETALAYSDDLTIPAALVPRLLESPLSSAAIADFATRVR